MPFFKIWFYRLWITLIKADYTYVKTVAKFLGLMVSSMWALLSLFGLVFWLITPSKDPMEVWIISHKSVFTIVMLFNVLNALRWMGKLLMLSVQEKTFVWLEYNGESFINLYQEQNIGFRIFDNVFMLGNFMGVVPLFMMSLATQILYSISIGLWRLTQKTMKGLNFRKNIQAKNEQFLKDNPEVEAKLLNKKLDKKLSLATKSTSPKRL